MNGHPYRDLEQPKRGPLSRGEKILLGLKGFVKLEPLLEQHRFGLDPKNGLPMDERLKHARHVAGSDSTDNLFKMIQSEPDVSIRSFLVQGFLRAFKKKYQDLKDEISTCESGMAAISCHRAMGEFKRNSVDQMKDLIGQRHIELEEGRTLLLEMGE